MRASEFTPIDAEATVESTLELLPGASAVFFRHRMACVGCAMSRFDTLHEAAAIYGISVETLIAEIEALAVAEPAPDNQETIS